MQKLLILGAGPLQIPLIRKANKLGLYTIAVDIDPNAVGRKEADDFFGISTNDIDSLIELTNDMDICGVITNSDFPMRAASAIAEHLNLNSISLVSANIATHKLLMREILADNGFNSPKFAKVTTIRDIEYHVEGIGYPFILKPVDSSASRGVSLIIDRSDIPRGYERAKKSTKNGLLIMEQYIPGQEYSVETFSHSGKTEIIAITEKLTSGPPYFVELGHIIPARISIDKMKEISTLVTRVLYYMGINKGPAHTEIKINQKGIYIIEVGARLGGDYITSDLVPLATGYDLVENSIRIATRMSVKTYPETNNAAGVFFFSSSNGVAEMIDKLKKTSKLNIVRYEVFHKAEENRVRELSSSLDRAGYVIVQGENTKDIFLLLEEMNY